MNFKYEFKKSIRIYRKYIIRNYLLINNKYKNKKKSFK